MAGTINLPVYSDVLVVLGTAGIVVPLVKKWGLSPVLGYLGVGALLGPLGLGSFAKDLPILHWVTIIDAQNVAGIADLGVVFLLFLIGLELSFERLVSMRRLVFGLGSLQVGVTAVVLSGLLMLTGMTGPVAIVVGACLALSSTAIVLEVLSGQGRMATRTGRTSFAVLLAQDLAVIPILMFISVLGMKSSGSIWTTTTTALLHVLAAVSLIVVVGRLVLRPLFRLVASTRSAELFIAAILFVIIATGVVAAIADLSMALGAFVAGLLLAETEYRKAIEATIEPFKGLLLGIFFFTVGMSIDIRELLAQPVALIACVIGLIALKAAILIALATAFGISRPVAVETGLLLGPGGEFAFVGIGLAKSLGVLGAEVAGFVLAVTSLTMAFIPILGQLAHKAAASLQPAPGFDPALAAQPAAQSRHAIVVGYGRVGKVVATLLERNGVTYTAVDSDPITVSHERALGKPVYYGSASDPAFLKVCGVMDAAAVIVTIHDRNRLDAIVQIVRGLRPDIKIVARAKDSEHARHLYVLGVTDAVPETIEASLQLSEAALVDLGVPMGPVIASIHGLRDEFRDDLLSAAKAAGLDGTRAVKAKAPAV